LRVAGTSRGIPSGGRNKFPRHNEFLLIATTVYGVGV
jgi:hypothetical protein